MIDLYFTGRRTGRTNELMRQMRNEADAGGLPVMIVHSEQEAERVYWEIVKWYSERDINCRIQRWQICTPDRKPHGHKITACYIDNLEMLLHYLTGYYDVKTITLNSEYFNLMENI